jgi:NADH-quinone oxidoreductase subunit F
VDWLREQVPRINLSFCALAQGAMGPLESLLRLFGDEVLDHVGRGRCPLGEG